MAAPSAQATAQAYSPRRRVLVLVIVALAFVMDLLDTTIVNVAVPSIQQGLHAGPAAIQWSIAGYTLVFAVLLITGGRLGDVVGYRRMFLCGVGGFTLASLACGLAPTAAALVAARLTQGVFAALMVPQVMALMQVLYPPEQRGKVYAVFGLLGGTSAALGPILGGVLIEADWWSLGWRLCFLINLPVGLFSVLAGWRLLPPGRSEASPKLDPVGAVLSIASVGSLVLALIEGPELHWPVWCLSLLLASVPLAAITWQWLRRRQASTGGALFDPALMSLRGVRLGLLCGLCLNGLTPAYLLVMTYVLQLGLGFDPLRMAWISLPTALGAMVSITLLGQRLMQRFGARTTLFGAAAFVLAFLMMAVLLRQPAPATVALLACQFVFGLGIGLTGPPVSAVMLQDVPVAEAGAAAGLVTTSQQLSGALGIALAGLLFFWALRGDGAAVAGSSSAYAQAYSHVLPLLVGMAGIGALIAWRLPPMRHGATVAVH